MYVLMCLSPLVNEGGRTCPLSGGRPQWLPALSRSSSPAVDPSLYSLSVVDCSECTLHATNPTNLNESIASYQASIDGTSRGSSPRPPSERAPR